MTLCSGWCRAPLILTSFLIVVATACGSKPDTDRAQLEQEVEALRATNQEVQKLRADIQELPRLQKDNQELQRLRKDTEQLPKLREENNTLRGEIQVLKPSKK